MHAKCTNRVWDVLWKSEIEETIDAEEKKTLSAMNTENRAGVKMSMYRDDGSSQDLLRQKSDSPPDPFYKAEVIGE